VGRGRDGLALGQTTTKGGLCRRTDPGTEPRDLRSEETRRRRGRRTSSSLRRTKPDRAQREASPHEDRTKGLTRIFFYISHPLLVRTCLEVYRAELRLLLEKNYSTTPGMGTGISERFFVIYDSQFPLASSRFGRDSIQYRVCKTHCQGHQDPSKSVPIFLRGTEALIKMVPIWPVPISRSRTVL
jgi:hypothetical protein